LEREVAHSGKEVAVGQSQGSGRGAVALKNNNIKVKNNR
jgi:uncharacterized protein (UPF0254 family)